jgi:hypothetical protein
MTPLDQLSQHVDALAENLRALSDPDKAATTVRQALITERTKQAETTLVNAIAQDRVRRARNKANKTLKSGQYAYMPREYGKVRITDSGAVYIAAGVGWRRVKGKAALDVKQMVERADAKAVAVTPLLQAVLEGRAAR